MTSPNDMLPHDGGPCPVAPGTVVEVQLRNGRTWQGNNIREAGYWGWGHFASYPGHDIVAYRIITPAKEPGNDDH